MKKNLVFIFVIALLLIGLLYSNPDSKYVGEVNPFKRRVDLLFVGDIMLSRQIGKIIEREANPNFPFLKIFETTRATDITFGNLETPVSERGVNQGSIYSFRSDPNTLNGLDFAGFDIVSVANNHTFDWGSDAFIDTVKYLKESGIQPVGGGNNYSDAHSPVIFDIKGQKICFLAYSEFASSFYSSEESFPAMSKISTERIDLDIKNSKNLDCEATIVSFHWGEEYQTTANEYQKAVARKAIDSGALLVIGHHPHVVQEVEKYKDGLIAYSLGNFVFDQNFSEDTQKGLMLFVTVKGNKILDFHSESVMFNKDFQPYTVK